MNFTAIFALFFGIFLILISQKLDGGSLSLLIQPAAFCIVVAPAGATKIDLSIGSHTQNNQRLDKALVTR